MNWIKLEDCGADVIYIDGDPDSKYGYNRIVEIVSIKKNHEVRCHVNDRMIKDKNKKFKTLSAAKNYGEKWFANETKNLLDYLKTLSK